MISYALQRNAIRLVGERSSTLDLARGRIVLIATVFIFAYMTLAVRAFDLTIIQGQDREALPAETMDTAFSPSDSSPESSLTALRADIRDRNGVLLATTLKTASLYADTRLIDDPQATAAGLSRIFPDLAFGNLLQKLQSGKGYVWIKRGILPTQQAAILDLGQPGLEFEYEPRRIYPQGPLVSHLLGYTNIDTMGQAGIERGFNKLLTNGEALDLTIDVRLQHALRREIQKAIADFSALGGAGVIMDANTGEILAGVSLPDFDPHKAGSIENSEIFNRLTLGVYEMGSVFKIFSTAALLETKNVPLGTTFDTRTPIRRGRFTINDFHPENRVLTLPEVFMYSSNIGAAMMGEAVGTERLRQFYSDLGLLTPLDFEIREVTPPIAPRPWGELSTLTASYGHGIATTPLQVASAVSTIVNGGYMVKPTLIKHPGPPEKIRVVSAETSKNMRSLLRLVVTDGTGKNAEVQGFQVGGKTGTAEKVGAGRYERKKLLSSFVGAFPMDNPRWIVFIMIDEPQGTKASYGYATGGWVAAPAAARVIGAMASMLPLKPRVIEPETDVSASLRQYVVEKHP